MLIRRLRNEIEGETDRPIILVLIGLFLAPIFVREMFLSSFYQINIFAAFGCFEVLYLTLKGRRLKRRCLMPYVIIACLTAILIISEIHADRTAKGFVRVFMGLIMPLPLMFYEMHSPKKTIHVVLSVFRFISVVIVAWRIIDTFTGSGFLVQYYNLAHDSHYAEMAAGSARLYSYIGHPLYNAELFLMTFGLNYTYNELIEKNHKRDAWVILVTLMGVAMTASKSAIAIFLALLILFYLKSIRYTILSAALLMLAYSYGFLDLVIQRFGGSLTTGRSEVWKEISASGIVSFHFFWGNGSDSKYKYENFREWARAAFEYPFRLYALEFGILFTILIFLFLFVIPEVKIWRNRTGRIWISIMLLSVIAHVNVYNGIGTYTDALYLYCLFGCVVLNMSTYIQGSDRNE